MTPVSSPLSATPERDQRDSFRSGLIVGLLNPKAVLFHVAVLSQFLDPQAPVGGQFLVLTLTATVVVGTVLGGYAMLAAQARHLLQSAASQRRAGYLGGGFLLSGSVLVAATR